MATKFVIGRGTTFSISTDGTTFTPINQLKTVSFSGSKADLEDITNMGSTGGYREFAPTLLDGGQAACNGVFNPDDPGQIALHAAFNGFTLCTFKLQFPIIGTDTTGYLRTFSGYVTEHNLDAQFDKASTLSATVKVVGPLTDTAPTQGS